MEDAPSVETLDLKDAASVEQFVTFWDSLISTWNPAMNIPPATLHPSAREFTSLEDTYQERAEILNRLQRHTRCSPGYCLRKNRQTGRASSLLFF
jgi:hypothetical protein